MTIAQTVVTSFRGEILQGYHQFTQPTLVSRGSLTAPTNDMFKMALYTSAADLGPTTTVYTTTGEVSGTGYVAGGTTLTGVTLATSGTTAYLDWSDAVWPTASITARGALVYNATQGNRAVAVLDFGSDKTTAGTNFIVQMPIADATNALVRITG